MTGSPHPREDLTALLDGALAPARAAEVEAHLGACPACQAEAERLRGALAALGALPPAPALPHFFATRLEARLQEERAKPRSLGGLGSLFARLGALLPARPRALAWAGGAAAALLVLGVPLGAWLHARADTRAMMLELDLLQDWDTASAVEVDSPEDVQIVARLDELERGEAVP
jgi:anti-sigma factor RsiW